MAAKSSDQSNCPCVTAGLPTVFWVLIGASARRMLLQQTSAQS
jgi:hypothetical protein